MKNLLSKEGVQKLSTFFKKKPALVFDFDGTLVPIEKNYLAVKLSNETKDLLKFLASRHPCAIISGRDVKFLSKKLVGIPFVAMIGNHGIEWNSSLSETRKYHLLRQSFFEHLLEELKKISGIVVEDKILSISIHYRNCNNRTAAKRKIATLLSAYPGLDFFSGKLVVNVIPKGAPDKGAALIKLLKKLKLKNALYIGDDITDENIFKLKNPNLLSVRVGKSLKTDASYYLSNQSKTDSLLRLLKELSSSHNSKR